MTAEGGGGTTVVVEAPARLHFGMLDLRGDLGRRFGGIGAGVPTPSLLIAVSRAARVSGVGPDAERAVDFARLMLASHGVPGGVRIEVRRAIPPHAGLGSGTQLALAVGRAVAWLYALPADAASLARATGRARRSAIGSWVFAEGGFVLEGGRRQDSEAAGPLLARLAFPPAWRCVVAVPDGAPGVSGEAEVAAFARLPPPAEREVERVAHLVLMSLLPALADGELVTFGAALSAVQRITGGWFAAVQGGAFAPGPTADLVRRMREWGAAGVGQSSWGPAAYGIVEGDDAAAGLAAHVRRALDGRGTVYAGPFSTTGARVWHEASPTQ